MIERKSNTKIMMSTHEWIMVFWGCFDFRECFEEQLQVSLNKKKKENYKETSDYKHTHTHTKIAINYDEQF